MKGKERLSLPQNICLSPISGRLPLFPSPRFERWGAWWCVDDEVDHWDDVAHCDDEKHEYDSTTPAFCLVWCFWCVFFFFGNLKFCFSFWSKGHQMYNQERKNVV